MSGIQTLSPRDALTARLNFEDVGADQVVAGAPRTGLLDLAVVAGAQTSPQGAHSGRATECAVVIGYREPYAAEREERE